MNSTTVRDEIINQIQQIASEQGKWLAPLKDDLPLIDSGLDSLCFAILVARLEAALDADPFSQNEEARLPVTLGELISFYEGATQ